MGSFRVAGRTIRYTVRRSESKYAHLRFTDHADLEITLPRTSSVTARQLLKKKRPWIERALRRIADRMKVFDRRGLLLGGVRHRLKVLKAEENSVEVRSATIFVSVADGSDLRQCIKEWMTPKTRSYAARRVNYYKKKLGFNLRSVEVGDSTRWGHCTHDRAVVFNWQLAALPTELADYVVMHEISHLAEFNHKGRFRVLLYSLCPDFEEREQALRSIEAWTDHE